jgi:hypothetical protein
METDDIVEERSEEMMKTVVALQSELKSLKVVQFEVEQQWKSYAEGLSNEVRLLKSSLTDLKLVKCHTLEENNSTSEPITSNKGSLIAQSDESGAGFDQILVDMQKIARENRRLKRLCNSQQICIFALRFDCSLNV